MTDPFDTANLTFGERCSAAFWDDVVDASVIFNKASEIVERLNIDELALQFRMNFDGTDVEIRRGFFSQSVRLSPKQLRYVAADGFFADYSDVKGNPPRYSTWGGKYRNNQEIMSFVRDRIFPVVTVRRTEIKPTSSHALAVKRMLIATVSGMIVETAANIARVLETLPNREELSSRRDMLTAADIDAIDDSDYSIEVVVALAKEQMSSMVRSFQWRAESLSPRDIVDLQEAAGAAYDLDLACDARRRRETSCFELDKRPEQRRLKCVLFNPLSRESELTSHLPSQESQQARCAGIMSNELAERTLFEESHRYSAEFGLEFRRTTLIRGDVLSPQGIEFYGALNQWIRQERLAEAAALQQGMLDRLPIRLPNPKSRQFFSIEQQLRASLCGSLSTIKGNGTWISFVGVRTDVPEAERVLSHYRQYLRLVADTVSATGPSQSGRSFVRELLTSMFTDCRTQQSAGSEGEYWLETFLSELFPEQDCEPGESTEPIEPVNSAEKFLTEEDAFRNELTQLIQGFRDRGDEEAAEKVEIAMNTAMQNRLNAFLQGLVSCTESFARGSTAQDEINSLIRRFNDRDSG